MEHPLLRSCDRGVSRALSLNPNDADLIAEYGDTLTYWGTPQEAITELKRAMKINPLYPDWYR